MTLRPKSFFFTLALILATQASYAQEHAAESPRTTTNSAANDEAYAAATGGPPRVHSGDPDVPRDSTTVVATQVQILGGGGAAKAGQSVDTPSFTQCPFMNEGITPAFNSLMRDLCVSENDTVEKYCNCLGRLSRASKDFEDASKVQAHALRRIGYQYALQLWSDRLGNQITAHQSYRNADEHGDAPASCKPEKIFGSLMAVLKPEQREIQPSRACPGISQESRAALLQAVQVVGGDELGKPNPNFNDLTNSARMASRIYRYNRNGPSERSGQNHLVDCMPPEDKRALSLLPINFIGTGFDGIGTAISRKTTLTSMAVDLGKWKADIARGTSPAEAKLSLSKYAEISNMMQIFPGVETLMYSQQPAEFQETIDKLLAFINHLHSPAYQKITGGSQSEIEAALALMASQADLVKSHVKNQLLASEASTDVQRRASTALDESCNHLEEDLIAIACNRPDFIMSPAFMDAAFEDAVTRRTKSVKGQPVTSDYRDCVNPADVASRPESLGSCMTFHASQCMVKSEPDNRWVEVLHVSKPNEEFLQEPFNEQMRQFTNVRLAALRNEADVVNLMCGSFNEYLREEPCNGKKDDEYRQCIVNPAYSIKGEGFAQWKVRKGISDPHGGAMAGANHIGREDSGMLRNPRNGGANNLKSALANSGDSIAAPEDTAAVIDSSIATNNAYADAFRGIGSTTPTLPQLGGTMLDITRPEEVSAAIGRAEQSVRDNLEDVRSLEGQIERETDDSKVAQLQSQINSLLAENSRTNQDLADLRKSMVERDAAARDAAVAASERGSDDEEASGSAGRREARGSNSGAGAVNVPSSGGFNIGNSGASRSPASTSANSAEFERAKVDTSFSAGSSAARSGGGIIQAAQALPAVNGQDASSRMSLRVGDASFPVSGVKTFELPAGKDLTETNIMNLISLQRAEIPLDAQGRAFVEIFDRENNSSVVVYVRINGTEIEFLDANVPPPDEAPGVRATLAQLKDLLGSVRE